MSADQMPYMTQCDGESDFNRFAREAATKVIASGSSLTPDEMLPIFLKIWTSGAHEMLSVSGPG
jgi:hypothetical protein